VARQIAARHDLKLNLVGFVQETPAFPDQGQTLSGRPILGLAHELESIAVDNRASRIIVAMEDRRGLLPTAPLVKLRVQGVAVEDAIPPSLH